MLSLFLSRSAQKPPASDGLRGGYLADGTPGPLLSSALDRIDDGSLLDGQSKPFVHSGLQTADGTDAAGCFGAAAGDPRVPDLVGVAQCGVVYTGGTKKIAEHGGAAPDDRDVPLVVSGPGEGHAVATAGVGTKQIAPTILALLHLDPSAL